MTLLQAMRVLCIRRSQSTDRPTTPPTHRPTQKQPEYEKLTGHSLPRFYVEDRRAQQLLVTHVGDDYFVTPSPELFSRHTGTCRVLGDKHQRAADHPLQVGDYLRIGSVGLVVSEMHTGQEGAGPVAIAERDLFYLREDAGELKEDFFAQEEAATAAEERAGRVSPG